MWDVSLPNSVDALFELGLDVCSEVLVVPIRLDKGQKLSIDVAVFGFFERSQGLIEPDGSAIESIYDLITRKGKITY